MNFMNEYVVKDGEDLSKYRPNVGLVIINQQGKVFLGKRVDATGAWQMPQGGIDDGESILESAFRELHEETGIEKRFISEYKIIPFKLKYNLPIEVRSNFWSGKYIGQVQTWVFIRFNGSENNISLKSTNHVEFAEYKWVDFDEVLKLCVDFKIKVYKKVLDFVINNFLD